MKSTTITPDQLRREADRLAREILDNKVMEVQREFYKTTERISKDPDLSVRMSGIAELARIVTKCPTPAWNARDVMLATIARMSDEVAEELAAL